MSTRTKEIIGVISLICLVLVGWVLIATIRYAHDAPARAYAAANPATTTNAAGQVVVVQQQSDGFFPYFWYGYMLGGWGNYGSQIQTTNNNYYGSPTYQAQAASDDVGSWGSDEPDSSGSWGSDSDTGSSYNSDSDSGSWGSDSDSGDSWGGSSDDGGSWGGDE